MDLTLASIFHVLNDQARMRLVSGSRNVHGHRVCICSALKLISFLFCCRFYHDLYVIGFVFVEL